MDRDSHMEGRNRQEHDEHKVDGDEVKLSGAARLPWLDGGTINFPDPQRFEIAIITRGLRKS